MADQGGRPQHGHGVGPCQAGKLHSAAAPQDQASAHLHIVQLDIAGAVTDPKIAFDKQAVEGHGRADGGAALDHACLARSNRAAEAVGNLLLKRLVADELCAIGGHRSMG